MLFPPQTDILYASRIQNRKELLTMLTLFPKFKKRMIIFEVVYVALMVTLYVLKPTASPIALALMLIVGGLFIAAAQYINAVNTHNRQLNRL